jgi:CheY-like chemotaxis protein
MKPSILVVDDDQDILWTLKEILTSEGFPVRVARNGIEGLTAIEDETPGLILLDLWMPQMDGTEMARELERSGEAGEAGAGLPEEFAARAGAEIAGVVMVHGGPRSLQIQLSLAGLAPPGPLVRLFQSMRQCDHGNRAVGA